MRLRPDERQDRRLLIIKVTDTDMALQKREQREGRSLSDESLEKLLQKLKPYQPRAIGLDIYRDFHLTPHSQNFRYRMSGGKIHAHMLSQLFSATLDGRPLLWW